MTIESAAISPEFLAWNSRAHRAGILCACCEKARRPYMCGAMLSGSEPTMIYILAALLPPIGLLLNGQPFSALINLVLIVPCVLLGLIFPVLFLVPSIHAIIAVYMKREDRKHRELVDAIEKHGPPPGWRP
jgi:hypothetical protein